MRKEFNIINKYLLRQFDFISRKYILFGSLFFLILPAYSFAQTLYLKPYAGGRSLLCSYDKKIGCVSTFKINSFQLATDFGLLINYQIKDKLSISIGISLSQTGWSYSLKIPSPLVKNPYGSMKTVLAEAAILHRFPIMIDYTLAESILLKNTGGDILKTVQYKIGSGINIDHIPDINNFEDPLTIWTSHGDTIQYFNKPNYNPHKSIGISLAESLSLCIHNRIKNKDIFELTFYYDQGLINIMSIDVTYQLNSIHSKSRLYTKGTDYGVILRVPICIVH